MKRKILSLALILVLCLGLAVSVSAASGDNFIVDNAELLTGSEEAALESKLQSISRQYQAQIVIVTLASTEGRDIDSYVEKYYDSMTLGYGQNHDGVLLMVSMDLREYRILSNGFAADAISLYDIDSISNAIVSDLSDGYYADAFEEFADQCAYYLEGHVNGFPFRFGRNLIIALVIGILAGIVVALGLKSQLKSVRKQNRANVYMKSGSMQITSRSDLFLYRNVSRARKANSSSSGSSGSSRNVGGGSF